MCVFSPGGLCCDLSGGSEGGSGLGLEWIGLAVALRGSSVCDTSLLNRGSGLRLKLIISALLCLLKKGW